MHFMLFLDGIKLPMTDRQSVSTNGTLIVEPVDRPDAGSYTCIAESKQGSVSQRTINVRVMGKKSRDLACLSHVQHGKNFVKQLILFSPSRKYSYDTFDNKKQF